MKTNALVPLIDSQIEKFDSVRKKVEAISAELDPLLTEIKSKGVTVERVQEIKQRRDGLEHQSNLAVGEAPKLAYHITGSGLHKIAVDVAEQQVPGLFKNFYPRIYNGAGQYHSPKILAAYLCEVVRGVGHFGIDKCPTSYKILSPALQPMIDRKMPLFFLAPQFLEAIKRTDFKEDINWAKLKLPYEEGVFVLPKGALTTAKDGEVGFLVWSRKAAGSYRTPAGLPTLVSPNGCFSFLALCPETGCWVDSTFTDDKQSLVKLNNLFYRREEEGFPSSNHTDFDEPLSEEDAPLIEQLGVLVFSTLMAMEAIPSLLERGKCEAVAKAKKDQSIKEFWSPNVIGKNYRFKTEGQGTHASPRMHWRRGHFRNQVFGMGRAERKIIWVEPCLVSAEK